MQHVLCTKSNRIPMQLNCHRGLPVKYLFQDSLLRNVANQMFSYFSENNISFYITLNENTYFY